MTKREEWEQKGERKQKIRWAEVSSKPIPSKRTYKTLKKDTEYHPEHITLTVKHSAGSIMMWRSFSSAWTENLVKANWNMSKIGQKHMFKNNLKVKSVLVYYT